MKTFMANPAKIDRKWYAVDAEGQTLGRLASEIAKVLRGKNKPEFTPHIDTGDYVIVINAEKIQVTGKKMDQKVYYHHSDYVGGMKEVTLKEKMAKKPEQAVSYTHLTAGLDPKGRDEILGEISELREKTGMTIVLVSHSMEDVANYVNRIIVMNKGSVMYDDEPKKVFRHVKELEAVGLAAPSVTYIMHTLKEAGLAVETDATTLTEARDAILAACGCGKEK